MKNIVFGNSYVALLQIVRNNKKIIELFSRRNNYSKSYISCCKLYLIILIQKYL